MSLQKLQQIVVEGNIMPQILATDQLQILTVDSGYISLMWIITTYRLQILAADHCYISLADHCYISPADP